MFSDKRRGDVYYMVDTVIRSPGSCVIGKNRPVIIVSSDDVNLSGQLVTVVPLTSSQAQLARGDGTFNMVALDSYLQTPSMALPRQVRTVDARDLDTYCCHLRDTDMARIDNALRQVLGL